MLYPDFLPRELIYIINTYLGVKNPLIQISEYYKNVHKLYLNNLKNKLEKPRIEDVHNGLYNPFKCEKNPLIYRFTQTNNGMLEGVILSTTEYSKKPNYYLESSKLINSNTCVIYSKYYTTLTINTHVTIYKDEEEEHKYTLTSNIYPRGEFKTNKWIKIWEQLSLEDQNAILYQNGFPLKE